jgi:DNA-binding MarR family transcriptional regulator
LYGEYEHLRIFSSGFGIFSMLEEPQAKEPSLPLPMVQEVLGLLANYVASGGQTTEGFRQWLTQGGQAAESQESAYGDVPSYGKMPVASEVGRLIAGVSRRIRQLSKHAMTGDAIDTLETFGILGHALERPGIHKTELIGLVHMEVSSGSDSLQRLIKLGLLSESVDEADRRARRLHVTPAGMAALQVAFAKMNSVCEQMFGMLSQPELAHLRRLLVLAERTQQTLTSLP